MRMHARNNSPILTCKESCVAKLAGKLNDNFFFRVMPLSSICILVKISLNRLMI